MAVLGGRVLVVDKISLAAKIQNITQRKIRRVQERLQGARQKRPPKYEEEQEKQARKLCHVIPLSPFTMPFSCGCVGGCWGLICANCQSRYLGPRLCLLGGVPAYLSLGDTFLQFLVLETVRFEGVAQFFDQFPDVLDVVVVTGIGEYTSAWCIRSTGTRIHTVWSCHCSLSVCFSDAADTPSLLFWIKSFVPSGYHSRFGKYQILTDMLLLLCLQTKSVSRQRQRVGSLKGRLSRDCRCKG